MAVENGIETTAEAAEASVLSRAVHTGGQDCAENAKKPAKLGTGKGKSPAQWAYERIALYIRKFEETLDSEHEVGMGFVGTEMGVMHVQGMGWFAPDIVTFYGVDARGGKMQLIQHVTQLNVALRAAPRQQETARRIGFELAQALEEPA
ncbi:hypothetical protein [Pontivivens ytuae]|uniref:hypothetical protein n=1 Tax=Pontivivens ytuae TaxID=2789856 RepID=UPI0030D54A44